jgi:hypothetical protein
MRQATVAGLFPLWGVDLPDFQFMGCQERLIFT